MKETPLTHVCIVGCGDIGIRVASLWLNEGMSVYGIVRSEESAARLNSAGIQPILCDLGGGSCELPQFPAGGLLYYFVPPTASGREDLNCLQFLSLLDKQENRPLRLIAISTTGVYGNRQGALVSEDDEPNPQVDRAYRRYDMENRLRNWCGRNDVDLVIFRVGGIYGPGRLPLARIKKQIPVLHEELAPKTNRIHADDLAGLCKAAATAPYRYRVYNASDGQDSNMTEYFYTLADYFKLPRPPAVDWETAERTMSEGMLSYLRESRRLDITRLKQELDYKLRYPDLLTGLESCKEEN